MFRILFFDHDSFVASGYNSSGCMSSSFVMKRTNATKAKDVGAPANPADPQPSAFPGGHPGRAAGTAGQERDLRQGARSAEVPGAPGPKNDTGTSHIVFKLTSV